VLRPGCNHLGRATFLEVVSKTQDSTPAEAIWVTQEAFDRLQEELDHSRRSNSGLDTPTSAPLKGMCIGSAQMQTAPRLTVSIGLGVTRGQQTPDDTKEIP